VGAALLLRVFGYAYAGVDPATLPWDLLTDVAFFSETLASNGTLPVASWNAAGKKMVDAAHAHGARCVLTVNLFNSSGGSEIATFLGNASAVSAATQAIVAAVAQNGGDGVDLDFEFVPGAYKSAFVSFVSGLASAMHAAVPGSEVSVAMPSVSYPGYDIAALGQAADTLMIMAYDYHWSTSDPGPVAPLADSAMWGAQSQTSTVALFTGKVDPARLLLGMPLYGYDYHATSASIPTTHVAGTSATAVTYAKAETIAPMYGAKWDAASSTPYYQYTDATGARQCFYEDAKSLGMKIDLAVASRLGGIGLWELSYAAPSFWNVVGMKLSLPLGVAPTDPPSSTPEPTPTPMPTQMNAMRGCSFGGSGNGLWWLGLLLLRRKAQRGIARR
jgi:spore germination protein YaaH